MREQCDGTESACKTKKIVKMGEPTAHAGSTPEAKFGTMSLSKCCGGGGGGEVPQKRWGEV